MEGTEDEVTRGQTGPATENHRIGEMMFWNKKQPKPNQKGITVQQGVAANALSIQALVNVLVSKNVCTREEILDELKIISEQGRQHVTAEK
jgi:hypothetical protein